ncbi:MAG: cyclase family protein [Pyrinomonadaceae bacterium]|nr:cyclase family protein [Pyrinomonadaceae bacterium]
MLCSIQLNNQTFQIDSEKPLNIAIPLDFYGAQPNAYNVERAVSKPCEAGELVGDTRRGGSCNFEQVAFIPHCNGTHTECVGHITNERISVNDCLKDVFIFAELISVVPEKASETNDSYVVKLNENDSLITKNALEKALQSPKPEDQSPKSLIVRTFPNDDSKLSKTYLDEIPPFFSTEAMSFLNEIGIEHLLVDLPSIDRIFDEGKLNNHRIFWNVEAEKFELNAKSFPYKTVTELIYISDEIADGEYLLNLQIAPFAADASPSRPILFRLMN